MTIIIIDQAKNELENEKKNLVVELESEAEKCKTSEQTTTALKRRIDTEVKRYVALQKEKEQLLDTLTRLEGNMICIYP